MPNLTDITGLVAVAAVTASAVRSLPGISRFSGGSAIWLFSGLLVLLLIPFGELPWAAYVRGATGDLSVATLLILVGIKLVPNIGNGKNTCKSRRSALIVIAAVAIGFYPLALGWGSFDPYQLGYGSTAFVVTLLLLTLLAWLTNNDLIALCISLSLIAWAVGWYESDNLWDYLIDPFISIYALAALLIDVVKAAGAKRFQTS